MFIVAKVEVQVGVSHPIVDGMVGGHHAPAGGVGARGAGREHAAGDVKTCLTIQVRAVVQ